MVQNRCLRWLERGFQTGLAMMLSVERVYEYSKMIDAFDTAVAE